MILTEFPNLRWLKAQADARFRDRKGVNGIALESEGWPTVVLNTKTSHVVRDDIPGPLSIFTNLSGVSNVTADRRRVTVTPETFFISNNRQHYTLEINEKTATETFNVHIGERFSTNALPSFFSSPDQLLENYPNQQFENPGFHNRLIRSSKEFKSVIFAIKENGADKLFLEENLFQLLSIILNEQEKVIRMRDKLNTVKSSTKEEILKRLLAATDYLYTFYNENPDLDDLASISCMSKFHFLRVFKLAYGQTPHQFITTLKINRAKELLRNNSEIGKIARQLGFETTSSFSRTFYNSTGVYPSRYTSS
jgi:AraC family transcriptional regulator